MTLGWLERAAAGANDLYKSHPVGVAATIVALLGGGAATAFGIAPLAPDAADLPRRVISETVVPEAVAPQLEALSAQNLTLVRSDTTRAGDTADSLLARLGIADADAAAFIRRDAAARRLFDGRPGKMVQALADRSGALHSLVARFPSDNNDRVDTHFARLTVARDAVGWLARQETVPLQSQVRLASGDIRTTFFAASDEAHLPDGVAVQMAEMFATDIDFRRELKRGDTFSVVYEALLADGEPINWDQGTGRVLAAEFVNDGQAHQALWYQGADGKGAYFGFDGKSKRRAFLASPMEFSRVTSGFSMRFHPILQSWRAHLGVDYGAPYGTPVRSVGDGTVEFAGQQNGYGNVIQLRHANERVTLYAHLSRIDVRKGQRVEQGQRIGAVGATGWATGPHLHFEFKINGQQQDPLKVAKASDAVAVAPASRADFATQAERFKTQLAVAETLAGSPGYGGE